MKDESQQQVPPDRKKLFYRLDFEDCGHDFDYTICRNMKEVSNYLMADDTGLGEDINDGGDDSTAPKVEVTGVWMTENEYQEWGKENDCDLSKLPPPSQQDRSVSQPGDKELFANWLLNNAWRRLDDDNYAHQYKTFGGFPVYKKTKDLFAEYLEPQPPTPKEQAIEVLNRQIQERDNRIKELEEEVKEMEKHVLSVHDKASDITDRCIAKEKKKADEFAIRFAQWFHEQDPEWNHDADQWMIESDDSNELVEKKIGFTDAQLIAEYKKTQTK